MSMIVSIPEVRMVCGHGTVREHHDIGAVCGYGARGAHAKHFEHHMEC